MVAIAARFRSDHENGSTGILTGCSSVAFSEIYGFLVGLQKPNVFIGRSERI